MKRGVAAILIAVLFLAAATLIVLPDYESPGILKTLILSQVMFGLSILLFLVVRKLDINDRHRRLFYGLLAIAFLARLAVIVGAGDKMYLSDDVYRYVWDGKVTAHGINPYLYGPREAEVAHLKDSLIHPRINHPWLPTIYPPMAQNVFLLAYAVGGDSILGFKIVAALFELLTTIALFFWLRVSGINRANLLLWLYSPLILIEFYLSTHVDILGLPMLVGALISLHRKRPTLAGVLLAMATLVKFYGLLLVPFFFLGFSKEMRMRFSLAFIGGVVILYVPYLLGAGGEVFGSLFKYLSTWQFNGSIFILLKFILEINYARIIVGILFVGWILWVLFRNWTPVDRMYATLGGHYILTPTFFPWYFVWIFPFVMRNLSPAFLFLSGSVLLSYHYHLGWYERGEWTVIPWLGALEYVPFYVLLVMELFLRKRTGRVNA